MRSATPAARTRRLVGGFLLLIVLAGLGVWRSAVGTRLDSFTMDEPWHIVAGASYVRSGDFRLNPEHPPLAKLWVGAAMPATFVLRPPTVLSEKTQERTFVEETLFLDNDAARAQATARTAMWTLHAVLLVVLGTLLWRACGWAWAAGTLAFLAIEPTVGAHLPVVMTDLPLALTLALATVAGGLLAARWQWRWALAFGAAVGLALGAKHSALAGLAGLLVVLAAAAALRWRDGRGRAVADALFKLATAGLLALALLWAQYGFHAHAGPDGSDAFNRTLPDKLAELASPAWRGAIGAADRWHLLPRAYLWGLADTVRTGVEGRGISEHFIWGTRYHGRPPWFSWPAIVLAKLPLALLALALLGGALLWRARLSATARWTLFAAAGTGAFHLLALAGSGGVWGGVRHALPLLVLAALPAGAAVAEAWRRRSRPLLVAAGGLLALALATTIGEPRLWEYHNALAGGSANAYRYFGNEGLDLGQRFGEIRTFHDRVIAADGRPLYANYWMGEAQTRAAGLDYRRRVEHIDDTNVEGIYEGWFAYPMSDTLPWPSWDWDPQQVFAGLEPVVRLGQVQIWKGRQVLPQARASSMYARVEDYIYREGGTDWALVVRRLGEVTAVRPQMVSAGIELGNAYLRLGDGPRASEAYRRLLEQTRAPLDARVRAQLEAHVAQLAAGADPAALPMLRNPWLE